MNFKTSYILRGLFFTLAILSSNSITSAQEIEIKINTPVRNSFENNQKFFARNFERAETFAATEIETTKDINDSPVESGQWKKIFAPAEADKERRDEEKNTNETEKNDFPVEKTSATEKDENEREKFHWKPALIQSGIFLGIQHGYRLTQQRTKRELGGPFLRDWTRSVKGLRGWNDSDSFGINYILHPLQGGLTGRIFVNNSDRAKRQEFGKSKEYWESRFKAMVWSAVWSTQFELGPVSEASIGNVGSQVKRGHSTMAFVDLVVTPTLGTGFVIGEDAIDKYILKNWVEKNARRTTVKIRILRSILTPATSVSNLLRGKVPWKRDSRLLK